MRGLKSCLCFWCYRCNYVALYTSAWIEIPRACATRFRKWSRTLHECVDWNNYDDGKEESPIESHSTRVRGLKYPTLILSHICDNVALYTSAWIEIQLGFNGIIKKVMSHSTRVRGLKFLKFEWRLKNESVALYTSAWIEISQHPLPQPTSQTSHSTRVRGLKSKYIPVIVPSGFVALYTSAWIEIILKTSNGNSKTSHSTRVRGLKYHLVSISLDLRSSHSTRVRGLK